MGPDLYKSINYFRVTIDLLQLRSDFTILLDPSMNLVFLVVRALILLSIPVYTHSNNYPNVSNLLHSLTDMPFHTQCSKGLTTLFPRLY